MPRKPKAKPKPTRYSKTLKKKTPAISSSMPFNHYEKKSRFSDLEKQFEFPDVKSAWQEKGKSQKILGSDFVTIDSLSPIIDGVPRLVEFELRDNDEIWSMGPNTRFKIEGQFQVQKPPAQGQMPKWEVCNAAEIANVVVQANWSQSSFKLVEMFYGNSKINTSAEVRHVAPYVNAFKYAYMNKEQLKLLCPQAACSGNGVPYKRDNWNLEPTSEWTTNYGPSIFTGKTISFDEVYLDMPFFFQGANYMEVPQNILPMPVLDKITVRFSFIENLSSIFNVRANCQNKYRFYYQSMKLVVEKLKLSIAAKTSILSKRGKWDYSGVTRIMKTENIVAGELMHKAKIQGMLLPEGLFIFALPKKVLNGTYAFQGSEGNVFSDHNLESIEIKYGDLQFFMNRPNLGMFQEDVIEAKLFNDYLTAAPFGLNMDPDKVTVENIKEGWKNTPYPHVYINLCNYGDKSRIVPYLNDGSMLKNENDMELTLNFGTVGAVADVTYIIYYFYTDNNLTLDTSHKNQAFFKSPYLKLV